MRISRFGWEAVRLVSDELKGEADLHVVVQPEFVGDGDTPRPHRNTFRADLHHASVTEHVATAIAGVGALAPRKVPYAPASTRTARARLVDAAGVDVLQIDMSQLLRHFHLKPTALS